MTEYKETELECPTCSAKMVLVDLGRVQYLTCTECNKKLEGLDL